MTDDAQDGRADASPDGRADASPDGRADAPTDAGGDPPPDAVDSPDATAAGTDGVAGDTSRADVSGNGGTEDGDGTSGTDEAASPDDGSAAETAVADPEAYTTGRRTVDPRVRWLWIVRGLVIAGVLGGATAGIALAVAPDLLPLGAAVGLGVAVLGVGHALLLYRSWEYRVRDDSMYLHRGVVTQVQTVVPYVRVQHIDTSRGPIERAAGLSSLVIYTAGSRGADVTVPGLTPEEATDLQTRLKALAIASEGEDAV